MKNKPKLAHATRYAVPLMVGSLAMVSNLQASEKENASIATEAYLYLYPLVVQDYTRRQLTNVPPGKPGIAAPMNTFAAAPSFPTPAMHSVPRPNFDTLYSPAWVDLTAYDGSGSKITPAPFVLNRDFDMKTPPNLQVEAMSPVEFFSTAAELMKLHSPHLIDSPIVQRMTPQVMPVTAQ